MFPTIRGIFFALIVSLSLQLPACKKKEAPPSPSPARVAATKAFERYFGPPPTTDKGTCFAFVIFFPSAKEKGKLGSSLFHVGSLKSSLPAMR